MTTKKRLDTTGLFVVVFFKSPFLGTECGSDVIKPDFPFSFFFNLLRRWIFHTFVFDMLSAPLLRGKCNVTLLNETDVLAGYLEKEVNMPSVYLSLAHYFDT